MLILEMPDDMTVMTYQPPLQRLLVVKVMLARGTEGLGYREGCRRDG